MEFATLERMVAELEKEKQEYLQRVDAQVENIRRCIAVMKEEYRRETMPEADGVVEYLLERGRKRFGEKCVEACDIPEEVLDDLYEWSDRKVDVKRIVLGYCFEESFDRVFWFVFTDTEMWELDRCIGGTNVIPYHSIIKIEKKTENSFFGRLMVDEQFDGQFEGDIQMGSPLKCALVCGQEQIIRLLHDMRDYVNRS